jgi:hypothetical protein
VEVGQDPNWGCSAKRNKNSHFIHCFKICYVDNKVLRKIFGSRKNEGNRKLGYAYCLMRSVVTQTIISSIFVVLKSRKRRYAGHVLRIRGGGGGKKQYTRRSVAEENFCYETF